MSDFDDIGDELLELAGADDKKQKKRSASSHKSSSSKRRKANPIDSDSDDEPESEDHQLNPYPLDGKYKDEEDRERLLSMSEFDREEILTQRNEEMDRLRFKQSVSQKLMAQSKGEDSVSNAAKRQHTVRGATKEKTRKLDELKARRKAKDEKKRNKNSSPRRDRSSSPMDMETSDDEEEDGQISKFEQEEEKERKLLNQVHPEDEPITLDDLKTCWLSRDLLAKHCMAPWFEEYIKGSWVRYLIGSENSTPVYRLCEVLGFSPEVVKPYKINDKSVNRQFELRHGKSVRTFAMDKASNSTFDAREFDRLAKVCASDCEKLPSKRALERKAAGMEKLVSQPMTESDIAAMLAMQKALQPQAQTGAWATMERSRLTQARNLALKRQDYKEAAELKEQLDALASQSLTADNGLVEDQLTRVNRRNREANLEAIRKAELLESERKRKERKLAAASGGNHTPSDPSARLKTRPRVFNAATPASRFVVVSSAFARMLQWLDTFCPDQERRTLAVRHLGKHIQRSHRKSRHRPCHRHNLRSIPLSLIQ
ncbi:hypothetical protein HGRIS_012545 [Hohenbuehelia grisea]|uniref:Plus3 domain-containing protein n=2 Tax=Hohenbuehelia grisea TaxID=104357 RepID=A0ABR3ISP4_9AGAR